MSLRLVLLSATLVCLVLLSSLLSAHAQAYHFSRGWNPGKKRSAAAAPSSTAPASQPLAEPLLSALRGQDPSSGVMHSLGTAGSQCSLRPSIKKLILDLIEVRWTGGSWTHIRDQGPLFAGDKLASTRAELFVTNRQPDEQEYVSSGLGDHTWVPCNILQFLVSASKWKTPVESWEVGSCNEGWLPGPWILYAFINMLVQMGGGGCLFHYGGVADVP